MTDKRKIKQAKSNRRKNADSSEGSPRDEFRKRRKGGSGHPEYIYRKVGNNYEFIGITHSPITRGVKNIKLDKNPDPSDESDAYIKPTPEKRSTSEFHKKPLKGKRKRAITTSREALVVHYWSSKLNSLYTKRSTFIISILSVLSTH